MIVATVETTATAKCRIGALTGKIRCFSIGVAVTVQTVVIFSIGMPIIIFNFKISPIGVEIMILDFVRLEIMILDFVRRITNLEFQMASKTKSLAPILKI